MDQSETCHLKDRAIYLKDRKIIHVFLFIPQEKKKTANVNFDNHPPVL